MNFTYINICEILKRQNNIMIANKSNIWIFIIFPLLLGFIFSLIFYKDSSAILNVLTLFLSIFIPIFINLLATLISFVMNKIITRHNKERIPLIKQTFYNICYLIPISLIMLLLSLFMNISFGKELSFELNIGIIKFSITYHRFFYTIIGTFFYGGIIHTMLNLLMITKRIFKLFDKEIDLLTSNLETTNKEKNIHDINASDGEE